MTQLRWISWLNLKQHPILFQHGIYGNKNKEITKKERKRTLIQKRTIYNKQEKTLTCHYPCLKLQIQNSSRYIIMPNPKLITKKNKMLLELLSQLAPPQACPSPFVFAPRGGGAKAFPAAHGTAAACRAWDFHQAKGHCTRRLWTSIPSAGDAGGFEWYDIYT